MQELIFAKANMTHTIKDDAWNIISGRTSGYRITRGEPLRRADMRDVSENLPAGGYLSTASDLALFALALNHGDFFTHQKSLQSRVPNLIRKHTIRKPSSWRDAIPSRELYGAGVMFFPDQEAFWLGHTGRIAGGSAIVILQPENGLAIAVTTNAKGWNGYISFINKLKLILKNTSDLLN